MAGFLNASRFLHAFDFFILRFSQLAASFLTGLFIVGGALHILDKPFFFAEFFETTKKLIKGFVGFHFYSKHSYL